QRSLAQKTICSGVLARSFGRVEVWRGGLGGAYPLAGAFVCRCLTNAAMLRFHTPLIEPDRRISRIRLSEKAHAFAHGRLAVSRGRHTKPSTACRHWSENCVPPPPCTLCLAHHHWRSRPGPVDGWRVLRGLR